MEECLISCEGLVKIYEADHVKVMALQGLDLEIRRGEMMAIVGKSGSGKSTLLNMIGGLETPTAGQLSVGGRDLSALKEPERVRYRRDTVGFVWQKSAKNLFPFLTAAENVETLMCRGSRREKHQRGRHLLALVDMEEHADKYPAQLSGGEQQRVAIAAALANEPSILLADEPTGSVDSRTSDQIVRLFRRLNEELGLTILIVTHDMGLVDKMERTVMISDGKISTEQVRVAAAFQQGDSETEHLQQEMAGQNPLLKHSETQHEVFSVLDRARRLQLGEDLLEAAGIDSNMVRVEVEEDRIIIRKR